MNYLTESLNPEHNKKEFSCGKQILDDYLHKQANQDIKRKLTACFVMCDENTYKIKGYYTLSNNSIPLEWVTELFKKKITLVLQICSRYFIRKIGC